MNYELMRIPDRSVFLVFCCTLIGAAAQVLFKLGASSIGKPSVEQILLNPALIGGYCLYAVSTILLVLALRRGQLSLLYPVISLTYVWVTVASIVFFRETLNPWKVLGLMVVVAGVAVLGRDARS